MCSFPSPFRKGLLVHTIATFLLFLVKTEKMEVDILETNCTNIPFVFNSKMYKLVLDRMKIRFEKELMKYLLEKDVH